MNGVHDAQRLKELQALPLERKILISQTRIIEWYQYWKGQVCVSFSGGKDSTVLLHLVRQIYPDVPAVFSNTGLEYPEIQAFIRQQENVEIIRPTMRFDEVITKYGYPLIGKEVAEAIYYARRIRKGKEKERRRCDLSGSRSVEVTPDWQNWRRGCLSANAPDQHGGLSQFNKTKWKPLCDNLPAKISHYCCHVMKKMPMHKIQREREWHPYIGSMADESRVRRQAWIRHGCNAFDSNNPASQPLSFWTEQDVLAYLARYEFLEICPVYGDVVEENGKFRCTGANRTGCIFCGFGVHLEKGETRFQRIKQTHPRQYEYCIGGGQWADNPDYVPDAPEYDGTWKNWNPKKIWVPSKEGLGMGYLFDMVNDIYGTELIRYK